MDGCIRKSPHLCTLKSTKSCQFNKQDCGSTHSSFSSLFPASLISVVNTSRKAEKSNFLSPEKITSPSGNKTLEMKSIKPHRRGLIFKVDQMIFESVQTLCQQDSWVQFNCNLRFSTCTGKVVKTAQLSNSQWRLGLYLLLFLPFCGRHLELAAAQLTSNASSTATDLEALEDFKLRFLPDKLPSWTGSNFCNWSGVTCNNESRVVQLRLRSEGLTGSIPLSLEDLTSLQHLDLSDNSFFSPSRIPWPGSGSFSSLNYLNLSENKLGGPVPHFSGSLRSLQDIDLHKNRLIGSIPLTFGDFSRLRSLDLSENDLSGLIPPFSSFSSLEYLDLHANTLEGSVPSFSNFSRLRYLDLHNNCLNGSIPRTVGNFSSLEHLDLRENLLSGRVPTSICPLSSGTVTLKFLSLASNGLTGSMPDALARCISLTSLYLGNNRLSGHIPNFQSLVNLRTLDLSFNNLTGNIPRLPNGLTTLILKQNRLSGNLSKQAGHLPDSVELLSLSTNILENEIPAGIGKLANLTKLELNENSFRGFIPDTWQATSILEFLDLSWNNLSGVIPPSIANLTLMKFLNLDRNSLSGSIPPSVGTLSLLSTINLAENDLTGQIPPEILELQRVAVLNLSWNDLSGSLPTGLFNIDRWKYADVIWDHNPKLHRPTELAPAAAPRISVLSGPKDKNYTPVLVMTIFIVDGLLALFTAYALYACIRLGQPKEEKVVPNLEPSTGDSVTLDELRRITNNFHEDRIIGRGARSIVYKGIVGGGQVAVKVLNMENAERGEEALQRELKTLGRVRHRNLLRILAVCCDVDTRALILEFMPFSSVHHFLYKMVEKACLSWETRFNILIGVAQGLVYLHCENQEPIIHCDLKPTNILLDSDFEPKVADFGIAKNVDPDSSGEASMSGLCGTIGYIPPEYLWSNSASTKGDVFSFGMVLLELLTARKPYEGWDVEEGQPESLVEFVASACPDDVMRILDPNLVILELDSALHQQEVAMVLSIGLMCTQVDPKNRPDMPDVLKLLTGIKASRYKRGTARRRHLSVDELARLPTLLELDDDAGHRMLQESETNLEHWIAKRMP